MTLLVGCWEEHPPCKHCVMRCWCGYLSGARCRLFAYVLADATASKTTSSLASFKSTLKLPFRYQLTQAVLEKRLLNGCGSRVAVVLLPYCISTEIYSGVSNTKAKILMPNSTKKLDAQANTDSSSLGKGKLNKIFTLPCHSRLS